MISFEILVLSCLIENIPVAEVNSSKFFMACIDQHLTWNDLVNDIGTKVTKNVWILARVRNLVYPLEFYYLHTVCYSFIYPYLTSCIIARTLLFLYRLKMLSTCRPISHKRVV